MDTWRPQQYHGTGTQRGVNPEVLHNATQTGERIISVNPALTPVFSLRHLAYLTDVSYTFLRAVVSRNLEDPYAVFRIRKRSSDANAFRMICVSEAPLMHAQKWIVRSILSHGSPHFSSTAYAPGSKILDAANPHCNSRWLIKVDVRNFFESISEIMVYRVFRNFGFQPLVVFGLARLWR